MAKQYNIKASKIVATNTKYCEYKSKAKFRSIPFELTKIEFASLIFQNCYYCNRSSSNVYKRYNKGCRKSHTPILYNGVDRIDNDGGYFLENCVPCCKICNGSKRARSEQEFLKWITDIYKNRVEERHGY